MQQAKLGPLYRNSLVRSHDSPVRRLSLFPRLIHPQLSTQGTTKASSGLGPLGQCPAEAWDPATALVHQFSVGLARGPWGRPGGAGRHREPGEVTDRPGLSLHSGSSVTWVSLPSSVR